MSKKHSRRSAGRGAGVRHVASKPEPATGQAAAPDASGAAPAGPPSAADVADVAQGPGAGAMLRAMREEAGLELEVLAAALKVPPHKLQALEDDHPEHLPGVVFARGLAANVCRYLGHDAQPVLAHMQSPQPHVDSDSAPLRAAAASHAESPVSTLQWKGLPIWALGAIGVLVLAAIAVALWPAARQTPAPASPAGAAAIPASAASDRTEPASAAASPASASASAPLAQADPVPEQGLFLRTGAAGDVWVQIRGKANRTVFEGTLPANSQRHIPVENYPIRVTLGRVENVQVFDRGKLFDTSAMAASGVVRFNVR